MATRILKSVVVWCNVVGIFLVLLYILGSYTSSVPRTFRKSEASEHVRELLFDSQEQGHGTVTAAQHLEDKVRVLCMVLTCPQNLDTKAIHVKNTWGKRCNKLLFISSEPNDTFPAVAANVSEGRQYLTAKSNFAFRYAFHNYLDEFDWFMKADDDTYVIMENLRYFLSGENTEEPIFFGYHFQHVRIKQGYFSGGGGYVLSKEALRRLNGPDTNTSFCIEDGDSEDLEIGRCLESIGVKAGNATDELGRTRFHCFPLDHHLHRYYPAWFFNMSSALNAKISDYPISFHYVSPEKMHELEFYVYHLRPYGIPGPRQDINQRHTVTAHRSENKTREEKNHEIIR